MGGRVRMSGSHGIHCGKNWAVAVCVLAALCASVALAFTLTARLYLRNYYHAAHVAGVTCFLCVFVVSHHFFRVSYSLGCHLRHYVTVQLLLHLAWLAGSLVAAVAYSLLAASSLHANYDYIGALTFAWAGVLFCVYLTSLTLAARCTQWYSSYDLGTGSAYTLSRAETNGTHGVHSNRGSRDHACCSPGRCLHCWNVVFGIGYFLFHVLFLLVVVLTAYHPCAALDDVTRHRPDDAMYTVTVPGHRALALYMRCRGNGSETLVYENGLGGVAYMEWDFIPRYLGDRYTVCVYDRRGYGWSEAYEHDNLGMEEQWAKPSAVFLRELVIQSGLHTPCYFMGHSYGGHHIAFFAAMYPDMVKGLIFLDSSSFAVLDILESILEVIANFQPLGLIRIALESGLFDYKTLMDDLISFKDLSPETEMLTLAVMRSGTYFTAFMREWRVLNRHVEVKTDTVIRAGNNDTASQGLEQTPGTVVRRRYPAAELAVLLAREGDIPKPVLVIDAGGRHWDFPGQRFSLYDEDLFHMSVPGSSHTSLVMSSPHATVAADLIHYFVELQQGGITVDMFRDYTRELTQPQPQELN